MMEMVLTSQFSDHKLAYRRHSVYVSFSNVRN